MRDASELRIPEVRHASGGKRLVHLSAHPETPSLLTDEPRVRPFGNIADPTPGALRTARPPTANEP